MAEEPFPYEPLPEQGWIRLLTPIGSDDGQTLSFRLEKVELHEAPEYLALSYVWGIDDPTNVILVNGFRFSVRSNLFNFLTEYIRKGPGVWMPIWIDAITIDQSSIPERNSQVRQMRSVYQSASAVLLWLGDDDGYGEEALRQILNLNQQTARILLAEGKDELARLDATAKLLKAAVADDSAVCIKRLLSERDWWNRLWVVQEFINARSTLLMCGKEHIQGDAIPHFLYFAGMVATKFDFEEALQEYDVPAFASLQYFQDHLVFKRWMYRGVGKSAHISLASYLYTCRWQTTTKPLDRVYALLGVAEDDASAAIDIDYSKQSSQLSKEVAIYLMIKHGIAEPLSRLRIQHDSTCSDGLPSWVPDYCSTDREDSECLQWPSHVGTKHYCASGPKRIETELPHRIEGTRQDVLVLQGFTIDEVRLCDTFIGDFKSDILWWQDQADQVKYKQSLNAWEEFLEKWYPQQEIYITGCTLREAFWRTLLLDILTPRQIKNIAGMFSLESVAKLTEDEARRLYSRSNDHFAEHYQEIRLDTGDQRLGANLIQCLQNTPDNLMPTVMYALMTMNSQLIDFRSFFITKTGYIGLSRCHLQPGATICVLIGADVPYALTRLSDGHFTIETECYVHGIMDGEVIRDYWRGEREIQDIRIR